ncbi:hypothetical protein QYF61_022103 [Mycteria americana]|uniref:DBB domain-containing protein n=1 Tax=Mycteria americana TaxID=33587 RepID=A0AAN7S463_MYCAM|nr:hypothetical protein QYF61_022103 [Mycteria americana]
MPLPGTLSWALKSKSYGDMGPQKEILCPIPLGAGEDLAELSEKNDEDMRLDFIQIEQVFVFTHNLAISDRRDFHGILDRSSLDTHLQRSSGALQTSASQLARPIRNLGDTVKFRGDKPQNENPGDSLSYIYEAVLADDHQTSSDVNLSDVREASEKTDLCFKTEVLSETLEANEQSILVLPGRISCENPGEIFILLKDEVDDETLEIEFIADNQRIRTQPASWNKKVKYMKALDFPAGPVYVNIYCGGVIKTTAQIEYYTALEEIEHIFKKVADPIAFTCQAFKFSSVEKLDNVLTLLLKSKISTYEFSPFQSEEQHHQQASFFDDGIHPFVQYKHDSTCILKMSLNMSRGEGKRSLNRAFSASNPSLVSTQPRLEMEYYHAQKKAAEVRMSSRERKLQTLEPEREVLQPSDHFRGPPLGPLQQVHVILVLKAPELDTVLQTGSHQSRVEWQNHLPRPAGHTSFDAAQDTVGLLGCEHTLLAHVQLVVHQYPQVLFRRAALDHIIPRPVLKPRIAPTQDPLDDILSFWRVNCATQLGVICKLAEGALDLAVNVTDENIEQHWSQYGPPRDTTHH